MYALKTSNICRGKRVYTLTTKPREAMLHIYLYGLDWVYRLTDDGWVSLVDIKVFDLDGFRGKYEY